ncbi:hypothetical protein [Vibrio fluvialis]|uniref:hypothetical protein n=1 Tax=Vibrio fluvialis TaxID=676 RepID=UPI001C9D3F69|nr:hypothetical protein [Vibrio fluvialis]ELD1797640.1 hypothetical protein [Vibrio fluvialis]MBY7934880.1 hypothetical protein [Vibrio fluvialis]MCE7582095.1 hypothetical protein [Vibrio fluvialis]
MGSWFRIDGILYAFDNNEVRNSVIIALFGVVTGFILTLLGDLFVRQIGKFRARGTVRQLYVHILEKNQLLLADNIKIVESDLEGIKNTPREIESTPLTNAFIMDTSLMYSQTQFPSNELLVLLRHINALNHACAKLNSLIQAHTDISISIYSTADQTTVDRLMKLRMFHDDTIDNYMSKLMHDISITIDIINMSSWKRIVLNIIPGFILKKFDKN